MNLIWRGKKTLAFKILEESIGEKGTYSKRHCFAYISNEDKIINFLYAAGFVKRERQERENDMPRDYYYATQTGIDALADAEDYLRGSRTNV